MRRRSAFTAALLASVACGPVERPLVQDFIDERAGLQLAAAEALRASPPPTHACAWLGEPVVFKRGPLGRDVTIIGGPSVPLVVDFVAELAPIARDACYRTGSAAESARRHIIDGRLVAHLRVSRPFRPRFGPWRILVGWSVGALHGALMECNLANDGAPLTREACRIVAIS